MNGLLTEVVEARRAHDKQPSQQQAPGAGAAVGAAGGLKRPTQQAVALNPGLAALKSPALHAHPTTTIAPVAGAGASAAASGRGSNAPPLATDAERMRTAVRDVVTSERSFLESLSLLQQMFGLARRDEKVQAKIPAEVQYSLLLITLLHI